MQNSGIDKKRTAKHAAPKSNKSNKELKILVSVLVVLILIFGAFTVYVNGIDGIYPNTYVNGFLVSDMTEDMLADYLTATFSAKPLENKSFTLTCKDNTHELKLEDLGIIFDNAKFAEKIVTSGKEGNAIQKTFSYISRLFSPVNVSPVINYNETVLNNAFDTVTSGYETEPVGYTFKIEKDLVTIHNRIDGIKADREKATDEALKQIGEFSVGSIELVPVPVSPAPLDFDEFYKWLTSDSQEAYYEKVDGKVLVRDSKPKCEVDKQTVKNAITTLETTSESKVTIAVKTTEPNSTSDRLKEILYKDKLGGYSTGYGSSSAARANNVRLATSRINGIELMPGDELSYDKTILPRTYANGYRPAGVYVGNKSEIGMGGGICQPSSTLYAAALYANLEIVERHNHSLPVSYLPAGLDATIAEGYLDLRIRNNTDYPVKIVASADGGVVSFSIYGFNEKNVSVDVLRSFSGGAHRVTRVVKENGVEVKREQMTSSVYGTPEKDEPEEEEKKEEGETTEEETPAEPSPDTTPEGEASAEQTPAPSTQNPPTAPTTPTTPIVPETPAPVIPTPEPVVPEAPVVSE